MLSVRDAERDKVARARRRRRRLRDEAVRHRGAARPRAGRDPPGCARRPTSAAVETEDFVVDLAARQVRTAAARCASRPTEWHILETLARHHDKLVTQRELLQQVWGPGYETETNYLRVYMAQLRRKLEPDPSRPRSLITEPGIGYRLKSKAG